MKKLFWIIAVMVILLVSGLFWQRQKSIPPPVSVPAPEAGPIPDAKFGSELSGEPAAEIKNFTVSGSEFLFNPRNITVKLGEKIRLTFRNVGNAPHDWTIEGLGIKTKVIGGGSTDTVEFTAPAKGEHIIYCSVPGHREAGMVGKLIVQ